MSTPHDRRRSDRPAPGGSRSAFTLVELVVVIVILSILASLTLSGLAGARQRAKIDKTRSTIRKLHEIVIPLYESYVEKRYTRPMLGGSNKKVASTPTSVAPMLSSVAGQQVVARRFMAAADLPDLWDDAWAPSATPWATSISPGLTGLVAPNPRYQATGLRWPAAFGSGGVTAEMAMAYESAECLQMIVVRGGYAADAVEQFRTDEIGDFDKDGAPEFHDGWGRPISFIRWPAGFQSPIQPQLQDDPPDPMDPLGATRLTGSSLFNFQGTDRALTPLIYSGGPNNSLDMDVTATSGGYGLVTSREALGGGWQNSGWINPASSAKYDFTTTRWPPTPEGVSSGPVIWAGWKKDRSQAADNITNHDLVTK